MKVAINACMGGFSLSDFAVERLLELGMTATELTPDGDYADKHADFLIRNETWAGEEHFDIMRYDKDWRCDPRLIQVIEELGELANTHCSKLKIVEVPDGAQWHIADEDHGYEWIAENHWTWGANGTHLKGAKQVTRKPIDREELLDTIEGMLLQDTRKGLTKKHLRMSDGDLMILLIDLVKQDCEEDLDATLFCRGLGFYLDAINFLAKHNVVRIIRYANRLTRAEWVYEPRISGTLAVFHSTP